MAFGKPYSIEKNIDSEWKTVPSGEIFDSIGIMLHPGDQYKQTVDISRLGKGEYRIVKSVHADSLDLSAELTAEFVIE